MMGEETAVGENSVHQQKQLGNGIFRYQYQVIFLHVFIARLRPL